ncbi:zinc C3HC4 type domain-containing protein [Cryptosporidium andersoni]|uniref:Zinc C3HC4 type domain-containing protein n=1 Tax=Cryptosporidium andersoni TaxID=117008 RepID=A0A1J4MBH9_9CRYT|nr:zinc C3HC4 type domain-containing protein [Cryptosporidium andersoni]
MYNFKCTPIIPAICIDPIGGPGSHNAYVSFICFIVGAWFAYRCSQLIQCYDILRLIEEGAKTIQLKALGPYSHELKNLMRVHLAQIIRDKRSVSPIPLEKVSIGTDIDINSIDTKLIPLSSSSSNPDESYNLEISFLLNSESSSTVQLFWGVDFSAAQKLMLNSYEVNSHKSKVSERVMKLSSGTNEGDEVFITQGSVSVSGSNFHLNHYSNTNFDYTENYHHPSIVSNISNITSNMNELTNINSSDHISSNPQYQFSILSQPHSDKAINSINPILYSESMMYPTSQFNNREDLHTSNNLGFTRWLSYASRYGWPSHSNANNHTNRYIRWNASVLGRNIISFNGIYHRILNRISRNRSNLHDSTRSLLELPIVVSSNNTNIHVPYKNSNSTSIDIASISEDIDTFMDSRNFLSGSPVSRYSRGLSQIYKYQFKLTSEYLQICKLPNIKLTDVVQDNENYTFNSDIESAGSWKMLNETKFPRIPLVIVAQGNNPCCENTSFCHIVALQFQITREPYKNPTLIYKPVVIKQVFLTSKGIIEPYDAYGLEDEELDCLICMVNPKDTVLLPCRHCSTCESCLRALRQDRCPLCRSGFSGFIVLPISSKRDIMED